MQYTFQLCSLFRLTTFDVKDLTSASWLHLNVNMWACNVHTVEALATPLFDYTSSQYLTHKEPIQFRGRDQESHSQFHSLISSNAKWSICCTCPIPRLEFHLDIWISSNMWCMHLAELNCSPWLEPSLDLLFHVTIILWPKANWFEQCLVKSQQKLARIIFNVIHFVKKRDIKKRSSLRIFL